MAKLNTRVAKSREEELGVLVARPLVVAARLIARLQEQRCRCERRRRWRDELQIDWRRRSWVAVMMAQAAAAQVMPKVENGEAQHVVTPVGATGRTGKWQPE